MKLWAIARNTFREYVRDKVLYNIMGFALVMIFASLIISRLSIAERKKITIDLSLSSISAIGIVLAVFLGVSLVSREIDKKTIYTLIAKPVERYLFILGRFLGLFLIIAVSVAMMAAVFAAVLWAVGGDSPRQFDWPILQALALILVELGIVTAAAMAFSTFSSPTLSVIFALGFWIAGRFTSGAAELIRPDRDPFNYHFARVLALIIPDLTNYLRIEEAALGTPLPIGLFLECVAAGALTIAFFLVLAMLVFQRRDFV